ncbi:MAG: hypothetical protein KDA69_14030, partial [Planctomycetaceae bacterium]|nr:hypothetical protein [Planctomycetaceae bacterium]
SPQMSQYQLSNIRFDRSFGRRTILIDWTRTKRGGSWPKLAGRTQSGHIPFTSFPMSSLLTGDSGTIEISNSSPFGIDKDVEIWIEASGPGFSYMISNSVRLGNPGPVTTPRPMTDQERAAVEQARLEATPPTGLPTGHQAVTAATRLIPGMPVKAGWMAQWEEAEVLGVNDDHTVTLLYTNQGGRVVARPPKNNWIAVDPAILAKAAANPESFVPSKKVLRNSLAPIPDEAVVIPTDVKLPKGTPVLVDFHSGWFDAYVIQDLGNSIEIHYDHLPSSFDRKLPRAAIIISTQALESLNNPQMVEQYASNLDESMNDDRFGKDFPPGFGKRPAGFGNMPRGFGKLPPGFENFPGFDNLPPGFANLPGMNNFPGVGNLAEGDDASGERTRRRVANHLIGGRIPPDAQIVPESLKIPEGTKLGAYWGHRFFKLTLLTANDDGTLYVRCDDFGDSRDCDMSRDQLIIAKDDVKKLQRAATLKGSGK